MDRVAWFLAPILIGGREAPSAIGGAGVRALADAPRLLAPAPRDGGRRPARRGPAAAPAGLMFTGLVEEGGVVASVAARAARAPAW